MSNFLDTLSSERGFSESSTLWWNKISLTGTFWSRERNFYDSKRWREASSLTTETAKTIQTCFAWPITSDDRAHALIVRKFNCPKVLLSELSKSLLLPKFNCLEVRLYKCLTVRKYYCPKVLLSKSPIVLKSYCPKVLLSKSPIVQKCFSGKVRLPGKFDCPKVQWSESSIPAKFDCPKVQLSESSKSSTA